MRCSWALAVCFLLWGPEATAQEASEVRLPAFASTTSPTNSFAPVVRFPSPAPVFQPLSSWWEEFEEESKRVRAEYERHPLERYHYVHNDRWHPVVFNFVTGYYSEGSHYFRHWYSSAKGITPLRLAGGRLALGMEFRRVLVFEADRRYSGPFPTPEPCYAIGRMNSPLCYSMTSFREGERRYGLTLRLTFGE